MVAQSPISCLCCCLLSFLLMVLEEQAFVSLRKSQVSRLRCCCAVVLTDFISSLCPGSRITESVDILCVLKGSTVTLCGTGTSVWSCLGCGGARSHVLQCGISFGARCVGTIMCPDPSHSTVLQDCLPWDRLAVGCAFGLCSVEVCFPLGRALRTWGKWWFWVETHYQEHYRSCWIPVFSVL